LSVNWPWDFQVKSEICSEIGSVHSRIRRSVTKKLTTFTGSDRQVCGSFAVLAFDRGSASEIPEKLLSAIPKWSFAVLLGLLSCFLILWLLNIRRCLSDRARTYLVPSEGFDPNPEAITMFASALVRARRLGRPKSASAVRVVLEATGDGLMAYAIEHPKVMESALTTALYEKVERVDPQLASRMPEFGPPAPQPPAPQPPAPQPPAPQPGGRQ
jgi:hypothetical protein